MKSFAFEAIGTQWNIDVYEDVEEKNFEKIKRVIHARIELYDKTYSRFRADSLITKIARTAGTFDLPEDATKLFSLYKNLYALTNGTFTPLIGDALVQAGYDSEYSLNTKTLHSPEKWDDVIRFDHPRLKTKKPVTLDFGAGGKGYLIDIIGDILRVHGIVSFCIDGSGDFLYKNANGEALTIGLEHPKNPEEVIGIAKIQEGSLCGSAGNRRKWGNFHHILNPHTLSSPTNILAVWVRAQEALIADALSTCLFFVPAQTLQNHYKFSYALIDDHMQLQKSDDFPGEFFYNEKR